LVQTMNAGLGGRQRLRAVTDGLGAGNMPTELRMNFIMAASRRGFASVIPATTLPAATPPTYGLARIKTTATTWCGREGTAIDQT
jgi:hypothetical protein